MKDTQGRVSKNADRFQETLNKWLSVYLKKDTEGAASDIMSKIGRGIIGFFCAWLFSAAPAYGGTLPYGTAFTCGSEKSFYFVLAGSLLGYYIGHDSGIYMISLVLTALLRILVCYVLEGKNGTRFGEPIPLRMAIGASGGFVIGIYRIFNGGFKEAQLYEAFFLIVFIPIATYMFASAVPSHSMRLAMMAHWPSGRRVSHGSRRL